MYAATAAAPADLECLQKHKPCSPNELEHTSDCASSSSMPSSSDSSLPRCQTGGLIHAFRGETAHIYVNDHNGKFKIGTVCHTHLRWSVPHFRVGMFKIGVMATLLRWCGRDVIVTTVVLFARQRRRNAEHACRWARSLRHHRVHLCI